MVEKSIATIVKFIKGDLSSDDKTTFLNWLDEDMDFRQLYVEQYKLWVKTGIKSVKNTSETQKDLEGTWKRINATKRSLKLKQLQFFRYAAVFIGALMIGAVAALYISNNVNRNSTVLEYAYSSGVRSNSKATLPDGTVVLMNANTDLTYYNDVSQKERRVKLNGEAVFEVVHDDETPFIVDCGSLKVVDVGTRFNIKAIQKEPLIETTLLEGIVDLHIDNQKYVSMVPGQKAIFSKKSKEVELISIQGQNTIAWTNNRFNFRKNTFADVLRSLSDWYDVDIECTNNKLNDELIYYNAERSIDVRTALDILKYSISFDYKIVDKQDKTQEIIIY